MRIVVAAAIALMCTSVMAQDAAKPAAMANLAAPKGASVFIVSPKNGATVGQDVHVVFGASGIKVVPATDTTPGTGHHHLLIDVKELPPLDAPIPADAQHIHYGKGQTEADIHLAPGDHTLQLDFADYRHVQFDPPLVSKKITIHVK
ncbi:MAG: DUF4399 domain-containing protein [Xanthomonadales bacterium PRO7]|nr:DUF4399 domain-containing protein [Xanthomonadales bacterium PRO7]